MAKFFNVIGDVEANMSEDDFNMKFLKWLDENNFTFTGIIIPDEPDE